MENNKKYKYTPITKSKKEGFKLVKILKTATEDIVLCFENDLYRYNQGATQKLLDYYMGRGWI